MASRLDKLFDLLESNNQSIRSAAAIQIGKLSTNSQVQIPSLLNKLLPYVKHKTWSVRIAAADALKHIGVNSKLWVPNVSKVFEKKPEKFPDMISLDKLNLLEILKIGTRLYSTDFKDLDEANADSSMCKEEISRHLGFIIPEECEIKNILSNEDFELHNSKEENKVSIENAVKMSLRSTIKKGCKRSHSESPDSYEPEMKMKYVVKEESVTLEQNTEWPWVDFCSVLLANLWDAKWEIRHGAATSLRELVRSQGSIMICKNGNNLSRSEFSNLHVRYQEEVMGRLLCTLALDQLSDFVSDEMVAPVRESCAQVLGVMSVHLSETLVIALTRNLLSLLDYSEWTVNHGSLLGLKYLIAARMDLADKLLPILYDPISSHLKENCDDDVRCAAAAALMPIFAKPGSIALQPGQLDTLKGDLLNLLALRPDYTSPGATIAVLQLLEKLYEHHRSDDVHYVDKQVGASINRLHWCYYSYSDVVRLAAVRTCSALLGFYKSKLNHLSLITLSQIMSHLFQRVLIDENIQVVSQAEILWLWIIEKFDCEALAQSCLERLDLWMCCAMQPARLSYGPGVILMPDNELVNDDCKQQFPKEFFIGGRESFLSEGDSIVREEVVLRARMAGCRLLAGLCSKLCSITPLAEHILITIIAKIHLKERLAIQRFVVATVLAYWRPQPQWITQQAQMLAPLRQQLLTAIEEPIYYQELLPMFRQMIKSCKDLIACYNENSISIPINRTTTGALNLSQCQSLVTPELYASLNGVADTIFSCAKTSVEICSQQHTNLTRLVEISLGRALLEWGWLPDMLTPLIKPLMDAVRCESRLGAQSEAAIALSQLVVDYIFIARLAGPIGKLVRNLVQYLSDSIDALSPATSISHNDILALHKTAQLGREIYPCQEEINSTESSVSSSIKLRGSRLALEKICSRLMIGDCTQDISLLLIIIYHQPMEILSSGSHDASNYSSVLASLRAMVTCIPFLKKESTNLGVSLSVYAQCVFDHGLCHQDAVIRHWSARILVVVVMPQSSEDNIDLCKQLIDSLLLGKALISLDDLSHDNMCLGSIEFIYLVIHQGILKYRLALVASILPVILRCLSAPLDPVRRVATHIFSLLLSLLPLEQAGADISILNVSRQEERKNNLQFIEGLLNPELIPVYNVHEHKVSASLRHYQEQGLNWLSFLNRYGLHGVLADDMGLGKTLQTICIIVGEYSRAPDTCPPSLVVCPPTLTSHWQQEIAKHVCIPEFTSVVYTGSVDARLSLFQTLHKYQIVITSYDILRNDIDRLSRPPSCEEKSQNVWNYIVLDEGHLIRNHKSKIAIATKSVCAKHRLMLTGTPIQNRVGELWSLFDFLMPGLLGTHMDFQKRYGRLLDHTASTSGKKVDSEAGTIALEQLHRQVLPFMLRRIKEDVLHELPPKIIQDYICTMTPIQTRLYNYCMDSQKSVNTDEMGIDEVLNMNSTSMDHRKHVFQALHYLRLVCNHPKLALCESHPLYQSIKKELITSNQSFEDIGLSGKLVALKQLILDCGIGTDDSPSTSTGPCDLICSSGVVSNHRLLVFCQTRSMISLVEQMIKSDIPKASYLRLDGSVSIKERQNIVDKFSQDASIDILLLTTSIGGLGLNLTSADIVIFVEHDWNPMRDLQAMDRAHRIGQKHTVNVYRLITADSIEEKIMNLQKFKLFIANNVVSSDNKQVTSMNTDSLLDIMNKEAWQDQSGSNNNSKSGLKPVLTRLDGVYDSLDEYSEEYNLESFVKKL